MTAEQSILGCAMLDPACVPIICGELTVEDFTTTANVEIFKTIQSLYESGVGVDVVTITNDLDSRGYLDRVGGAIGIADLLTETPTTANLRSYIGIVQDSHRRRMVLNGLRGVVSGIEDGEENYIETARKILDDASAIGMKSTSKIGDFLPNVIFRLGDTSRGKPTGFGMLDYMTGGFQDGHLIVIGARPSVGKTAFACNVAANMCGRGGLTAAFFTVEMSAEEIAERINLSEAMISKHDVKGTEINKVLAAQERIAPWNLYIDDRGSLSVGQIISACYKFKQTAGRLDAVFIDYLQLLRIPTTKNGNRAQELGAVSRALKILARELKCPVVALSQLNRDSTGREPTMADLRESGAIEQDADVVILLHRNDEENPNETKFIIDKNRHGEKGKISMVWYPQYTRFFEPAFTDSEVPNGVFNK